MNVAALVSAAADRLKRARIEEPRLEAESLLAYLLKRDLSWPLAHPEAEVAPSTAKAFAAQIAKRAKRVPYAYLTGVKAFYGRDFRVNPSTLIPRPSTEVLIEGVLARAPKNAVILDIGTGSGAIGLTLAAELPKSDVILYDVSTKALAVAKANAKRLKFGRRVRLAKLDILRNAVPEPSTNLHVREDLKTIIVANLPYLPTADWKKTWPEVRLHEPKLALVSGKDGLDHYRALFKRLARWKRKPALIGLEAEPGQFQELARLAAESLPGARIELLKDLHGDERVLIASKR